LLLAVVDAEGFPTIPGIVSSAALVVVSLGSWWRPAWALWLWRVLLAVVGLVWLVELIREPALNSGLAVLLVLAMLAASWLADQGRWTADRRGSSLLGRLRPRSRRACVVALAIAGVTVCLVISFAEVGWPLLGVAVALPHLLLTVGAWFEQPWTRWLGAGLFLSWAALGVVLIVFHDATSWGLYVGTLIFLFMARLLWKIRW
jgi:hypothetical protein